MIDNIRIHYRVWAVYVYTVRTTLPCTALSLGEQYTEASVARWVLRKSAKAISKFRYKRLNSN